MGEGSDKRLISGENASNSMKLIRSAVLGTWTAKSNLEYRGETQHPYVVCADTAGNLQTPGRSTFNLVEMTTHIPQGVGTDSARIDLSSRGAPS